MRAKHLLILLVVLVSTLNLFAQPTGNSALHITDTQLSSTVTLSGNLAAAYNCTGGCLANWTIPGKTVVAVTGAIGTNQLVVSFTPAVNIGEAINISHTTNDGQVGIFGPLASINNRAIICSDFAWESTNTPTPPCAPVDPITKMAFSVKRGARNSNQWNINTMRIRAHWIANGAVPFNDLIAYESTNAGIASANTYFISGDAASSAYMYPAADPVCGYTATYRIVLNANTVPLSCAFTNPNQQVPYASHNNDDTGVGADVILQPNTAGSDMVCVGTNVNMNFRDNTDLNCNPTTPPTPTNDARRYVRVVYGSTDLGGGNTANDNIPNVFVGGVQVTDANGNLLFPGGYIPTTTPFGVPDAFGVVEVPSPVTAPRGLLHLITTSSPVGQVVGQRFWVRIDYWNVCNDYDGAGDVLNRRRSVENEIEIIGKPVPLTTAGAAVCFDNTNNITGINFTVASSIATPTRTAVNWYATRALVGTATRMTNPNGTNSLSFPAGSYGGQGGVGGNFSVNNNNGRYHSVWVTQVTGATNSCESDPIEVVIIQQPRIDQAADAPGTPVGATNVCNGPPGTVETYTTTAPNTKTIPATTSTNAAAINLPTQNIWSTANYAATVSNSPLNGNSTDVTFNISPQPNPNDPGDVRVRRGYVTTTNIPIVSPVAAPFTLPTYNINPQACLNNNVVLGVTVHGQSDGGTISGTKSICNGTSTGNMTVTTHRGAILQWERSFNAGAFVAIAGTAGMATFSEIPPNGVGTYRYRVLVQNQNATGPCASATTINANQSVITVNPVPGKPTITQGAGSDGVAICLGQQTILQSDNPGAIVGVTYRWFKTDNMVTPVQSGASNTLTLNTIAQSGDYVVQIIGPATTNCPSALSDPITVTISGLPTAVVSGGGAACDGNPAPDIIWTFSGGTSYNFTIDRPAPLADVVETNYAGTTYTLSGESVAGNYQIIALSNAITGCVATVAGRGGPGVVTSSGGSPVVDGTPSIAPAEVCINGSSATDPVLSLKLTAAFGNTNGFILNYTINGGANNTKTFNTDATGLPTAAMSFSEVALNVVNTHTIRLVSIQSPTGCLRPVGLNLTYIVRPLPTITTQPTDQAVCVNGNVTYTAAANTTGGTTNFQWQVSTTGAGGPWTDLTNGTTGGVTTAGATTASLTLSNVTQAMNTNRYRVVVTGVFPSTFSCPVTSADRLLTVRPFATIDTAPVAQVTCSGTNDSFTVAASVALPSTITGYQWQVSTTGVGGPYTDLTASATYSGVTGTTLTISNPTTALNGNFYRVNVTTTGSCAQPTTGVLFTVNPLPVSNAITPIVCEDIVHVPGSASIGQNQATNVDLNQFSAGLADLPGAPVEVPAGFEVLYFQDAAHTVAITTPTTISPGEQIFTRVRNTTTGCFTDRTITFTVRPQPVPTNLSVQICEDNPPGSLVASGINLTSYEATITGSAPNRNVEWYQDASLTTLIPPGTLPNQEQNFSISSTTTLFAKIIDITAGTPGCNSVAELRLEYQPRPNLNEIKDGAGVPVGATYTVCASNNLVFLQIDPTINPGSTYTWNVPTPPALPTDPGYFELLTGTSGFFIILRFPSLNPSPGVPISVTERLGTAGCAGTTLNTSIIVEGSPPTPIITGPSTVCANSPATYSVPAVAGNSYSWSVPPGATITSTPVNSNTIDVMMSTFNGNVNVVVSNSTGCLSSGTVPLPVTVVTKPAMTSPNTNTICSGAAPDDVHTLTATLGGTTYRWEVISILGFVSGVSIGDNDGSLVNSNTPGAANIDSRTLTNTSGVNAAVIYRVIPVSPPTAGVYCEGNQQNVTITIQPEPNLLLTPKTVCSDEPANYEIRLSTAGLPTLTQFTWSAPVMSDGSTQGTSGTNVPAGTAGTIHINDAFLNTSPGTITATYTISAVSGAGCSSNQPVASRQVVITINPKPLIAATLDKPVCSDEAIALTLNTAGATTVTAASYSIMGRTIDGALIAHAGNADVPQSAVAANYLAADKFTNTSGGPLLVTYTVNARGSIGGCLGPDQIITITINSGPTTNSVTDEVCSDVAGGNTHVEDLEALEPLVNPDGTLIFEWYTDAAATLAIGTPTAYPLQNGVPVYVKVHNGVGTCAKIQPVEYVVNPTPAVTAAITSNRNGFNVSCLGSGDGTITANIATLGSPNYTYSVDGSTFITGRVFNGLFAADNPFVVTVRDAKGCMATSAPMNLTEPTAVSASASVTSGLLLTHNGRDLTCPGASDGRIEVMPGGGTGSGYSYRVVETNATNITGVFTGLPQGSYRVTVTDANGCSVTSDPVTITPPPVINASATLSDPASCNGASDGEITTLASGGTLVPPVPPNNYTFTINPGGMSNNTGIFTGLASSGVPYTVTVEDDNGCTVQSNGVVVTQPAAINAFISVNTTLYPGGSAISCFGANDAQLNVTANGGNGGYGYVLNVVTPGAANTTGNVTGTYAGVHPGAYTATVTDSRGCNITSSQVTVAQPADINVQQFITQAISCNGDSDGQIRLVATGGTGAFTYTRLAVAPAPTPEANGTGIFSNLSEFNYPFEVNDINGCMKTLSVALIDPDPVVLSFTVLTPYNGAQISCPSSKDGIVQLTTSGGNGNFSYSITNPVLAPPNNTGATSGIFNGLGAGAYTFHVIDPKGCNDSENVSIIPPAPVTISAPAKTNYNGQDVSCTNLTDGTVTVLAGGGTPAPAPPPYTYVLSPSSNNSGQTTGQFINVGPGTYTVTAFDGNNCSVTSTSITINPYAAITFPGATVVQYNGREVTCNGAADGRINSTPSGGAGGWTNYTISPTPGTAVNGGNGVFTGLPAGTYVISAQDANACPSSTASITVHQPDVLVASATVQSQPTCFNLDNASVRVSAVGGTVNYIFSINTTPSAMVSPPVASQHTFMGVAANPAYTVTVTDVNGCIDDVPVNPIVAPSQPLITASITSDDIAAYHNQHITCFGANDAIITALHTSGTGTGSLTYTLTGPSSNTTGQFTGVFTLLGPGGFNVTATDINGCASNSVPLTVIEPPQLQATLSSGTDFNGFDIRCFNEQNGIIIVTPAGGTGNPMTSDFQYVLMQSPSTPVDFSSGDVRFNNLRAMQYQARVRDLNGCTIITAPPFELFQPTQITLSAAVTSNYGADGTDISCVGANDGEISVVATIAGGVDAGGSPGSGVADYTYVINPADNTTGVSSGVFTGLRPNTLYTITATDANTCTANAFPVIMFEPTNLFAGFVGSSHDICIDQANKTTQPFTELQGAFGGNGSYEYRWMESTVANPVWPADYTPVGGATASTYTAPTTLATTTHYVREVRTTSATSALSCPTLASNKLTITVNPRPTVTIAPAGPICQGTPFGLAFNFTGSAPFTFDYDMLETGSAGPPTPHNNQIASNSRTIFINDYQEETTFTVTRVVDRNECEALPTTLLPREFMAQRTVPIIKVLADLTVTSPNPQCSGETFTFAYTVDPDVTYRFTWPDGVVETITPAMATGTISRVIESLNTGSTTQFPIILLASHTSCQPLTAVELIDVYPRILTNVIPSADRVCSDSPAYPSPIMVTNNTLGGQDHKWTVTRISGAGAPDQIINDPSTPDAVDKVFRITNTTNENPATYQVDYVVTNDPSNGSCQVSESFNVFVYKEAIAKIGTPKDPLLDIEYWGMNTADHGVFNPATPAMEIEFQNATPPLSADFLQTWTFSNNNPNTPPQSFPDPSATVMYPYLNPGTGKRAILNIVNQVALADGVMSGCPTRDEFVFTIRVPDLNASFTASDPACLGTADATIRVVNNSTGGTLAGSDFVSDWEVRDHNNIVIYTSNLREPTFPMTTAGRYSIYLTVRNPDGATSPSSFGPIVVDIYPNPLASFITSPSNMVFIPEQVLRTDNRSLSGTDPLTNTPYPIYYIWDFGDNSDEIVSVINPAPNDPNSGHSPTHRYTTEDATLTISLTAVNEHGVLECRSTVTQAMQARSQGTSKVPNAFTPNPGGPNGGIVNEDGTTINDVFLPITKGIKEFKMQIFDRWGNLVFESQQQNRGWDGYDRNGNLMPAGVYVYKLVLRMANDQRTTQVGDVTLIR